MPCIICDGEVIGVFFQDPIRIRKKMGGTYMRCRPPIICESGAPLCFKHPFTHNTSRRVRI